MNEHTANVRLVLLEFWSCKVWPEKNPLGKVPTIQIGDDIIYETFDLKINLNFILTMPFASPFGKYGDGKYVGIPRAEWFKRPEIKSIFKIRFIGRYCI